jgi:hypothetical protein
LKWAGGHAKVMNKNARASVALTACSFNILDEKRFKNKEALVQSFLLSEKCANIILPL